MKTKFRHFRRDSRGFTALELMLFGSISAMIVLAASPYFNHPAILQNMFLADNPQQILSTAINTIENDLVESNPPSINFAAIPPQGTTVDGLTFQKVAYDSSGAPVPPQSIQYSFQPDASGVTGTLIRTCAPNAPTVVLNYVVIPTASNPIFQADATLSQILIITLAYQPPSLQTPIQGIRRVAIRS